MEKHCYRCKQYKDRKLFGNCRATKDKLMRECKKCRWETSLIWRNKNLDKYKATQLKFLSSEKGKLYRKRASQRYKVIYRKNKSEIIKKIAVYNKKRDFGLYNKYWSMIRRCKYPSQKHYKWYGGKGIKVEWKSYVDFKNDMYVNYIKHIEKYGKRQTTIDRIDNNGNYCKENCRWATYKEQNNNKSNNRLKILKII